MKNIIIIFTLILFLYSCNEDPIGQQPTDSVAPGMVSNVTVENLNGAAKLTYALPNDKDLLYVKAKYTTAPELWREVKASYYTNSLEVKGFGDTSEYTVELVAVDRSGNESEPVSVKVNPLKPNITLIRESVAMVDDFGGINIQWDNSNRAEVALVIIAQDSLGDWQTVETLYTSVEEGNFSVRGFNTDPRKFGVVIRDRWENLSDTISGDFVPLLELELDKNEFRAYFLPTDQPTAGDYGGPLVNLWDNNVNSYYHTSVGAGMPQHCTFDLGVVAKLSRFKLWQRPGWLYIHGNPKRWEIWGSTDPNPDGSFDSSWTKLVGCEMTKPSGLPAGEESNEDIAAANRGHEYVFPLDAPKVRYIRIKTLETWSGGDFIHINEMTFWGQPDEN